MKNEKPQTFEAYLSSIPIAIVLDVPKATSKRGTDIRHLFLTKLTRPETELITNQSEVSIAFTLQWSQFIWFPFVENWCNGFLREKIVQQHAVYEIRLHCRLLL